MIELAFERTIPASPTEVFARLADLVGYEDWLSNDSTSSGCTLMSAGTIGRGSTYLDMTKMGTMVGEITEHDPPALLEFRQRLTRFGIPVFEATQTNELSACDGGTLLRHRFRARCSARSGSRSVRDGEGGPDKNGDRDIAEPSDNAGPATRRTR